MTDNVIFSRQKTIRLYIFAIFLRSTLKAKKCSGNLSTKIPCLTVKNFYQKIYFFRRWVGGSSMRRPLKTHGSKSSRYSRYISDMVPWQTSVNPRYFRVFIVGVRSREWVIYHNIIWNKYRPRTRYLNNNKNIKNYFVSFLSCLAMPSFSLSHATSTFTWTVIRFFRYFYYYFHTFVFIYGTFTFLNFPVRLQS